MMEKKRLYVADGHHRLSVALKLGLPYVAMHLTDMHADGIAILPYHRIVRLKEKKEPSQVLALLSPYFDATKMDLPEKRRMGLSAGYHLLLSSLFFFISLRKAPSLDLLSNRKKMG